MRVLVWDPTGPGEGQGTPGSVAQRLFSMQCFAGWSFDLYHGNPSQPGRVAPYANCIHRGHFRGKLQQIRFLSLAKRWLAEHAREYDAFFGVAAYSTCVYPAAWFAQLSGPSLVRVSGYRSDLAIKANLSGLLGVQRRRLENVREHVSAVVAVSPAIEAELAEYGLASKTVYIPNGVDVRRFCPPVQAREPRSAAVRIVYCGSINRMKRPHWIVSALQAAIARGGDCRLTLLGPHVDAEYLAEIEAFARARGLQDRLTIAGPVTDVASRLQDADIFAFPSVKEGMSNALLEAMASGLAIVATDYPGVRDVIGHDRDGLVATNDVQDFTACLLRLIESASLRGRLGAAARERAVSSYALDTQALAYRELIERLVANRPAMGDHAC